MKSKVAVNGIIQKLKIKVKQKNLPEINRCAKWNHLVPLNFNETEIKTHNIPGCKPKIKWAIKWNQTFPNFLKKRTKPKWNHPENQNDFNN